MILADLISILENALVKLSQSKNSAVALGDLEQVLIIENQENETATLLSQLKQLLETN